MSILVWWWQNSACGQSCQVLAGGGTDLLVVSHVKSYQVVAQRSLWSALQIICRLLHNSLCGNVKSCTSCQIMAQLCSRSFMSSLAGWWLSSVCGQSCQILPCFGTLLCAVGNVKSCQVVAQNSTYNLQWKMTSNGK